MTDQALPTPCAAVLETCPTPMLLCDAAGQIRAANHAFCALSHGEEPQLLGKSIAELPAGLPVLAGASGEINWTDPDGQSRTLVLETASLEDGGTVHWIRDISALVQLAEQRDRLQEELKAHSLTDPCTGLLNQRGVMLALEPQVARSRRYASAMAVIMMQAGVDQDSDALQVEVSRLLKDQLRWADVIGCTAQREFILVLPETSRDDALKLADKLSQRLHELDDALWTCYGVTEWQKSDNAGALLRRAGTALEQSRKQQNGIAVAL